MNDNKILLIDKPKGITSFDVIRQLRKKFGIKKIGHAGTLDPLASGLMVVGVGGGTKRLSDYIKFDKVYEVEMLIGEQRTTGDMEGEIIEEKDVQSLERVDVERVVNEMIGTHNLSVPAYSAIKVQGEPLYKKARRGEIVESPVKTMVVYGAEVVSVVNKDKRCFVNLILHVSSGSYVRSLVEEIGKRLGYPATTKELRRTRIGEYDIAHAQRLSDT